MYLHRIIIKNYRSIEYVDITFAKGKNIIVGVYGIIELHKTAAKSA